MGEAYSKLEYLWDMILSGQPGKIREAFSSLDEEKQKAILNHLQRMVAEDGWQPEQQASAQAAIDAITSIEK